MGKLKTFKKACKTAVSYSVIFVMMIGDVCTFLCACVCACTVYVGKDVLLVPGGASA